MVQRAKLALIILVMLMAFASGINAQTQTPRLLGEAIMILPPGWEKVYDPPEVKALIKVRTDSTAQLIRVLDAPELTDILADYINIIKVLPLIIDGNVKETELVITVKLQSRPMTVATLEEDEQSKALADQGAIFDWIIATRMEEDIHRDPVIRPDTFYPLAASGLYRHRYHYYGSDLRGSSLVRSGFSLPPSWFQRSQQVQNLMIFNASENKGSTLEFKPRLYDQPVSLAVVQAGLGDYDHNYARGTFYKNHFGNISDLFLSFSFLVQDGWWLEQLSGQTSWSVFTKYDTNDYSVSIYYDNIDESISSMTLNPIYWQPVILNVDHRSQSLILNLKTPYADLGVQRQSETLFSSRFVRRYKMEGWQLYASRDWDWDAFWLRLRYERAQVDRNYDPLYDNDNFDDRLDFGFCYRHLPVKPEISLRLDDFSRLLATGVISYQNDHMKAGLYARFRNKTPSSFDRSRSVYLDGTILNAVNIEQKHAIATYGEWYPLPSAKLSSAFGIQKLINNIPASTSPVSANEQIGKNLLFVNLAAVYTYKTGSYEWRTEQILNWQQPEDILREYQVWRYQSRLNLTRNLQRKNAIFGGLALIGHSSYISANELARIIDNSAIIDLWAGVRITDLFEFTVAFKNVNEGFYYGSYPIPRSIHASVTWFYLN